MKLALLIKSQTKRLFSFFSDLKSPKDELVHKEAEKQGIEPSKLEGMIYNLLMAFTAGGKAKEKGISENDVDPKELAAGIKIEMEHVNKKNPFAKLIAKRISLDHEAEAKDWPDPRYYLGDNGLLAWEKLRKGEKS